MSNILKVVFILVINLVLLLRSCSFAYNVSYDSSAIAIDGRRRILISGSIHYPRSTPQMWPDLIQKAKEGGVDVIETYVFWNLHEPSRGKYDFSGQLDIVNFFKEVQKAGLYGFLRIGPYACAEFNYGGFPVWLHNMKGVEMRTDNEVFKNEMQTFTTKIVDLCKEANLFASQGGPIILAQIENEYGNVMEPYGARGESYIKWCAQMAESQNVGVPWVMCQQSDAPDPMINTCNGYYCDDFTPTNPKNPKMWTENWIGWFKNWGQQDPHRTAEDCAFAIARFFQNNGIFQNYYMYHGGTNFGRTSGGPYIATSYDYDAPLDEYGNLNQPKWGHLQQLHKAIKSGEKILTNGKVEVQSFGDTVKLTTYTSNATGKRFCFLSNEDSSEDANVQLSDGRKFFVPAWSVSILRNCRKEIYNTAKVNTQTSVMVKTPNDSVITGWLWLAEPMNDTLQGKGTLDAAKLLEQKETTVDSSDYLWYMTSVDVNDSSWSKANLSVKTSGHVLHAFVNGKLIGSQWGTEGDYGFLFNKPVTLNVGTNVISLLSATVGLKNYGSYFDLQTTGIDGGPVKLIGDGNNTIDLSTNNWSYKVGLNGEAKNFSDGHSTDDSRWSSDDTPTETPFIWYQTTFDTPSGNNPVVLDLQGMGKGMAWVNGNSIGRFWPSYIASGSGCSNTCDYRGSYDANKCLANCGNPTQRWYHVPRSFLKPEKNMLVLFEELGGSPSQVRVQTVTIGTVCANAYEGSSLNLTCQGGQTFSDIKFASFGNPTGACGSFSKGSCDSPNTLAAVQKACAGKATCLLKVNKSVLGSSSCNSTNRLAVQATC